jgi:hypothetical protein
MAPMGIENELKRIGDANEDVLHGANPEQGSGLPGVPTPDQTRHDGRRPELAGELSQPETSGDLE